MPVLINIDSGLAENVPNEQADLSLQQQSHEIPLNDLEGNPVTAPRESVQQLIDSGYTQPTPGQLKSLVEHAKYSSPEEQAKTFVESAVSGATLGLGTGLETALGVDPKEIKAREETNPGMAVAGELTGLGASTLLTGGGAAVGKAGQLAARSIGGAGMSAKIAQSAVKWATESALIQGGNEVHKAFLEDPEQSAESAITSIGLAGVLGGALGGAGRGAGEAFWKVTNGTKLSQFLEMVKDKALSSESTAVVNDMADRAGMVLSPEMKAALSKEPMARRMAQELTESGSSAGVAFQESGAKMRQEAVDSLLGSLGRTTDDVERVANLSEHEIGEEARSSLIKELKTRIDPLSKQFDEIKGKYSSVPLSDIDKSKIAEDLAQMALKEGHTLSQTSPAFGEIRRITNDLKNLNTLEDLRKYQAIARGNLKSLQNYRLSGQIGGILRENESSVVENLLSRENPALLNQHKAARSSYGQLMGKIEDLNSRLHVGNYHGPDSFIKSLEEMAPETVIRRLRGLRDADLLATMAKDFPEATQSLQRYHLDNALRAASRYKEGLNPKALFNILDKWSPELKSFALPPGSMDRITAARELLDSLPNRLGPSGTARTLDALWKRLPGGIGSMLSMIMGHDPVTGYLLGQAARWVGREAPDRGKLAILRFLGSDAPVSAPGYKALHDYTRSLFKSRQMIEDSVINIFENKPMPKGVVPSPKDIEKLDSTLKAADTDPTSALNSMTNLAHYAPDHVTGMGQAMARAFMYLQPLRPNDAGQAVLDDPMPPSPVQEGAYNRALEIAQQPLVVMQHVKDGTILPSDIQAIKAMYPGLYQSLHDKMVGQMVEFKDAKRSIPYNTVLGISAFLGMPLESSIMPQNIMVNQMVGQPTGGPQQMPPGGNQGPKQGQLKGISKLASSNQTSSQSREANKVSG